VRALIEEVLTDGIRASRRIRRKIVGDRALRAQTLVQEATTVLAAAGLRPVEDKSPPRLRLAERTDAGAMISFVELEREDVVIKTAGSPAARASLDREARVLHALADHPSLASFRPLIPAVLADGVADETRYVVISALPGIAGSTFLPHPALRGRAILAAARAARDLHSRTGQKRAIGGGDVDRWTEDPLRRLAGAIQSPRSCAPIAGVEQELREGLVGREAMIGWAHGDYWSGNVLFSPNASAVLGVVDWDLAEPAALPSCDLVHLVVMSRAIAGRSQFGDIVTDLLDGSGWPTPDREILEAGGVRFQDELHERSVLLLTWLRHVAGNLAQSADYSRRKVWMRRNVDKVLRSLEATHQQDRTTRSHPGTEPSGRRVRR
jgi:aminoglycoside phosphotransferase (APT) family kinase protein